MKELQIFFEIFTIHFIMIWDIQMKLGFILLYAITFYFFHFWNQIVSFPIKGKISSHKILNLKVNIVN